MGTYSFVSAMTMIWAVNNCSGPKLGDHKGTTMPDEFGRAYKNLESADHRCKDCRQECEPANCHRNPALFTGENDG